MKSLMLASVVAFVSSVALADAIAPVIAVDDVSSQATTAGHSVGLNLINKDWLACYSKQDTQTDENTLPGRSLGC